MTSSLTSDTRANIEPDDSAPVVAPAVHRASPDSTAPDSTAPDSTAPDSPAVRSVSVVDSQPPDLLDGDLEKVLVAWQTATDRLQTTHELLRREIGRLSDELEEKNRELARQNRLADIGRMAAHIAHEVRNSLMPLTLYLSLLHRKTAGDSETSAIVEQIQSGFQGLEATVSDLLSFTSDRDPDLSRFSIRELMLEILDGMRPQLESQHITDQVQADETLWIDADRAMLRRALLNLVINSIEAMSEGGQLTLEASVADSCLTLHVRDQGTGISAEETAKIFDPFFTTKSEGTGLGLAIVERIVNAHAGTIEATPEPQGGTAFTLRIPQPTHKAQS